jgi:prolyl-tRNA synthetase
VGKGLANGTLEVKDRRSGTAEDVPVPDVADYVVRAVSSSA